MPYILENKTRKGCLFCNLLESQEKPKYILKKSTHGFLILNVFPYTSGHLMAIPYHHRESLASLSPEEMRDLMSMVALGERALLRAYGCSVIHGGVNVGHAAGAGVQGHVHIHLVPRREGDSEASRRDADRPTPREPLDASFERLARALLEDDTSN
jgi:ATP adenylyltransferase